MNKALQWIGLAAIVAALLLPSMTSCGICRPTPPQVIVRDSIRVEYRDREVHDTAYFQVPVEIEKIVTKDTASHLENSLAKSDAVVENGELRHSLETKPQAIPVPVTVRVTDTLYIEKQKETQTQTVEVERRPTLWERFRLRAFWPLVLLAIVGWRREIWALIKKFVCL